MGDGSIGKAGNKETNQYPGSSLRAYLMVSYMTRINYGAVIAEMEISTGFSRSLLSMALTGSFITYGVGQIVSGICGDKFSPKKLVSLGLIVTICMNLLIPLCQNPYQMLAVWCVNGFAQSFMWPPIVRLMTALLSADDYKKVTVRVSWGSSFGTIAVYFLAPVIITLLSWKWVFLICAVFGAIMLVVWNKFSYEIENEKKGKIDASPSGSLKALFTPLLFCVMLCIVLQGMLRDGVTTWMPSYISETYNLGSAVSILTGIVLPLFSIVTFNLAEKLYRKKLTNPLLCAGVIFGVGAVSAIALYLLSDAGAVFSVLFSALLTGAMHGVNLILICMIPPFFKKYGNVSTASGVLNSCTYIGSALSTYGIAVLSENMGWHFTIFIWFIIAVLGTAVCLLCVKPWAKNFGN